MSRIQLKSIKYSESVGGPYEWILEKTSFKQVNLIVGKNATGKSRMLNVINSLANLLLQRRSMVSIGCYDVLFEGDNKKIRYEVIIKDHTVENEKLTINDEVMLDRNHKGTSKLMMGSSSTTVLSFVEFSPPDNQLAVVVRRDNIQHKYLESLHEWAQGFRYFMFGNNAGKEILSIKHLEVQNVDERDTNNVIAIFRKAEQELGEEFVVSVKKDMNRIGYNINDLLVTTPKTLVIPPHIGEALCFGIKEEGLDRIIEQHLISQGMFRALSILIQVNYSQITKRAGCIVIDDIGEGLDFERSIELIKILREKADQSFFQLIMSTNDKFVMNNVPIEEWIVLQRKGGTVSVKNYENSKELFDEFKFTGLSNFSFFEMDFLGSAESVSEENA